jgi:hypothetical protein
MNPAEELRAAAVKLREMAAATAGGTWTAEYLDRHDVWWVNHETHDDGWTTHGTVAELVSVGMAGNAAWVALMGPDVAPGIAALLEHYANCVAGVDNWGDVRNCGKPIKQFARSILGETR